MSLSIGHRLFFLTVPHQVVDADWSQHIRKLPSSTLCSFLHQQRGDPRRKSGGDSRECFREPSRLGISSRHLLGDLQVSDDLGEILVSR